MPENNDQGWNVFVILALSFIAFELAIICLQLSGGGGNITLM